MPEIVEPKHYPAKCKCGKEQTVRMCYEVTQRAAQESVDVIGHFTLDECDWCDLTTLTVHNA
jgi:redox-regulated HSP33 family molecular chaperone